MAHWLEPESREWMVGGGPSRRGRDLLGRTLADMFPELSNVRPEYQPVTLRDLATMQSGLPTNPSGVTMTSSDPVDQRNTIAAWAFEQSSSVASRGTYNYSNVSYSMLGAMLERAWSTSYEAAIQSNLFGPLSISGADWGPQTAPDSRLGTHHPGGDKGRRRHVEFGDGDYGTIVAPGRCSNRDGGRLRLRLDRDHEALGKRTRRYPRGKQHHQYKHRWVAPDGDFAVLASPMRPTRAGRPWARWTM